jgi:hypothetical protein
VKEAGALKDRLGDQRGGSEWEPIKILLQRENPTYTTNSQPRILTRVCQGHVVTTDLPTLGTNPKRSQSGSTIQEARDLAVLQQPWQTVRDPGADGPRSPGRRSAVTGRTVRYPRADGPLIATERPEEHPTMRTVHTWSSDGPRATHAERTVRDLWADSPALTRTVRQTPSGQNQMAKRIETKTLKNTRRTRRTLGQKALCGLSAAYRRTVRQDRTEQLELQTASTTSPTRPWISQTT